MPRYLTVAQYKAFDTGMSLPTDASLAHTISRAESDIDDYMQFDPLIGGFDPHTCWFQHKWDERNLRTPSPNGVTPVKLVDRYRIQVSNISTTGAGFFATIQPSDCVINVTEQYIEIVPLQAVTYSLSPVILQLGLRPPIVQVDAELGYMLSALRDALYTTDNQNYTALRGFWASNYNVALSIQPNTLPPVPPVIYVNGAALVTATLSGTLNAGQAYTSLPITALSAALPNGAVLVVNDGTGGTGITVTLAAPANSGAATLSISSFTPAIPYGASTVLASKYAATGVAVAPSGYAVNYAEGQVTFATAFSSPFPTILADYTYQIPERVRDAAVLQTTWLLGQRALNKQGMTGLEMAKMGEQTLRMHRPLLKELLVVGETSVLCDEAASKLAIYKPIAVA